MKYKNNNGKEWKLTFCFFLKGFEFLDFTNDDFLNLEELNSYLTSAEIKTKRFPIELYLKKLRLTSLLPGKLIVMCIYIRSHSISKFFFFFLLLITRIY